MRITSVKIRNKSDEDPRFKGVAAVYIDNCFVIHNIRIINGENGLYLQFPNKPTSKGGFRDLANPTNSECRAWFTKVVLKAYEEAPYANELEEDEDKTFTYIPEKDEEFTS